MASDQHSTHCSINLATIQSSVSCLLPPRAHLVPQAGPRISTACRTPTRPKVAVKMSGSAREGEVHDSKSNAVHQMARKIHTHFPQVGILSYQAKRWCKRATRAARKLPSGTTLARRQCRLSPPTVHRPARWQAAQPAANSPAYSVQLLAGPADQ